MTVSTNQQNMPTVWFVLSALNEIFGEPFDDLADAEMEAEEHNTSNTTHPLWQGPFRVELFGSVADARREALASVPQVVREVVESRLRTVARLSELPIHPAMTEPHRLRFEREAETLRAWLATLPTHPLPQGQGVEG